MTFLLMLLANKLTRCISFLARRWLTWKKNFVTKMIKPWRLILVA